MKSARTKELIRVLHQVRNFLARSEESMWTALKPSEVVAILDRELSSLERTGSLVNRIELESLFVPTAEIQEISMASGWSDEYLILAEEFDRAVARVK